MRKNPPLSPFFKGGNNIPLFRKEELPPFVKGDRGGFQGKGRFGSIKN